MLPSCCYTCRFFLSESWQPRRLASYGLCTHQRMYLPVTPMHHCPNYLVGHDSLFVYCECFVEYPSFHLNREYQVFSVGSSLDGSSAFVYAIRPHCPKCAGTGRVAYHGPTWARSTHLDPRHMTKEVAYTILALDN